jgi:hypothetical protein
MYTTPSPVHRLASGALQLAGWCHSRRGCPYDSGCYVVGTPHGADITGSSYMLLLWHPFVALIDSGNNSSVTLSLILRNSLPC